MFDYQVDDDDIYPNYHARHMRLSAVAEPNFTVVGICQDHFFLTNLETDFHGTFPYDKHKVNRLATFKAFIFIPLTCTLNSPNS